MADDESWLYGDESKDGEASQEAKPGNVQEVKILHFFVQAQFHAI